MAPRRISRSMASTKARLAVGEKILGRGLPWDIDAVEAA
ncbi:MAG: hypothetical protein AVDCRST_MAG19-2324 [uncultured Thermomicrobiales bacterium]|uniref:Uncharacterized protein n=1 Tax=uncultured Thermomicrobiales bacterium TaxID=1645740 RepID=A0A6J4V1U6_9BACT|nr:MAG: hypothetical protein AVDCRST_MAG19-2324 [uncultured Thermomicrobiales bacterium]